MRTASFAGAAVLATGLAACSTPMTLEQRSVTPQGTLTEAATTPLADVNLVKVNIPDVLRRASADPYDPRGMGDCRAITAEIERLNEALGPDADKVVAPDNRDDLEKTADQAHSAAVVVVTEGLKSAVPFRGWIRQISGAARLEKEVDEAVIAGATRRGYLKGVGMRLNCAPPASPAWFTPVGRQSSPARQSQPAPAPRR